MEEVALQMLRGRTDHAIPQTSRAARARMKMTAMTPEEAVRHVVATEPTFAVEEVNIRGVTYKAFKNVPPTVPALMAASRAKQGDGTLDYLG